MKIWLISIFEQTPVDNIFSTRYLNIAEAALNRGHEVTFYASTFKHNTKVQRYDKTTSVHIKENYDVKFIKSLGYKKNISLKRLYSHYTFAKALLKDVKKSERPDIIYIAFPPISIAYEISKWAKKNDIPVVIDIIDPWPDIFKIMLKGIPEVLKDIMFFPMSMRVKSFFKKASAATGIGHKYLQWAKNFNPQIETHCCYPAAQLDELQAVLKKIGETTKKDPDTFQVIYAGSLASAYDIPTILQAAKILQAKYKDKIKFVIAGTGPQEELINSQLKHLSNLRYTGRLNKNELLKEYYLSDLGLIQHHKGATQTVTYKLFDLLACGIPIMNSLESELNDIVIENKVGLFNEPGNAEKLAENIEYCYNNREEFEQMKKRTIEVTRKLGDADVVYDRVIQFLEDVNQKNAK